MKTHNDRNFLILKFFLSSTYAKIRESIYNIEHPLMFDFSFFSILQKIRENAKLFKSLFCLDLWSFAKISWKQIIEP